ncbi:MAG: hypothetical protein JO142_07065 [Burkholderiales bacterium]|nr:hypothetical protein [Burkholderiales bacterium]
MKQILPRVALSLFAAMFVAVDAAPTQVAGVREEGGASLGWQAVKAALALSPEQDALWGLAEKASATAREATLQDHTRLLGLLDEQMQAAHNGFTDIDAVLELTREASRQASDVARERWLAVFDSLDMKQKQIASAHIRNALGRLNQEYVDLRMANARGAIDRLG